MKIGILNQKGGVGKTTTTANLGAGISKKGKKVLLVDLDPQGNLTKGFGIDPASLDETVADGLRGDYLEPFKLSENLFLLPSNIELAQVELELINSVDGGIFALKNLLKKYSFDYVLIDCPPSLGKLTINALVVSDKVIIPVESEFYALQGFTSLLDTINLVKERLNDKLQLLGVLITKYDRRQNLHIDVKERIQENLGDLVFNTVIRKNVTLAEAPAQGKSIFEVDVKSRGAEDYEALTNEVLNKIGGEND